MFPIKMMYDDDALCIHEIVDVYKIHVDAESTYVVCWVSSKGYWVTCPISFVRPIEEKSVLKE